ncbi:MULTISPECIES: GAF domain-containing SpoIIE family protein phosphatase [unclassified Treponema]|uniref:GAF domain-containing SpoIIE family protein phosphatase n=1 Tax=unclassified Treponema TaxID=2638727 RepID=UPI0020A5A804|nr:MULTISPECIES: GAF domain-containing SpoIIE family protein phosphatase [unclassified Treponema]UTC65913.1 SpoIIE family protein phosphatase [Treponema sp. OMZ 789]UTC68641.1 SpoIIE family protein phosphatase [Treponema sp. OMZ 790]UTC71371.1 SpoIIE family protein phosphatase [Treponema sp. OMZ 791]
MKEIDSLDFYALITLSVLTILLFLLLIRMTAINKKKAGRMSGPFVLLTYSTVISAFIISISAAASAVFESYLVLNIGLSLVVVVFTVYMILSERTYLKEQVDKQKKEKANAEYIQELKNLPSEESLRARKLISTARFLLQKTNSLIAGKKDISSDMFSYIAESFLTELTADGAAVLAVQNFEEVLAVKALTGSFPPPYKLPDDLARKEEYVFSNFKHARFEMGESIFTEVASSGKTLVIGSGKDSSLLPDNGNEKFLQHGSLIFFPLIVNTVVVGLAAVSRRPNRTPFSENEVRIGEDLSGFAAEIINLNLSMTEAAEHAEIENITDTVAKIQKILLPKNLKKIPGLEIGEYFLQERGICSDYYDVIVQQKRIFIVLADVAGKSIQSAIIMIMIRAILYLITNTDQNTESILDWLNKGITGKIDIDHFASISLLSYEPKSKTMEFIGAGNQAMMVWKKQQNKIELFQQKTDPIGIDVRSIYKSIKIPLQEGDAAALYTDGVIESLNASGEQYGTTRLAQLIADNHSKPSKEIVTKIKNDMISFIGKAPTHDDRTLLIIKAR